MSETRTEEQIKKDVEDLATINFSITKCPLKTFKAFTDFCKKETSDNYSFGLKILLETREANIKEVVLYEQYTELRDEVEKLKAALAELKGETPRVLPKTMGSGGKKNEQVKQVTR